MDSDSSYLAYIVVGIIVLGGVLWGSSNTTYDYSDNTYYSDERVIDKYDARSDYWDEIKEYINGMYTAEACSGNTGNCYDLDIDVNGGYTDTINFPNGGYVYITAEIDSDGRASDFDDDGDYWEITFTDSDIEEAVEDWANANDYILE